MPCSPDSLLYHVVPGAFYSAGVRDGQWLETLLDGQELELQVVTDGYTREWRSRDEMDITVCPRTSLLLRVIYVICMVQQHSRYGSVITHR